MFILKHIHVEIVLGRSFQNHKCLEPAVESVRSPLQICAFFGNQRAFKFSYLSRRLESSLVVELSSGGRREAPVGPAVQAADRSW